jgi:arylsulfatase A-like enzyme
LLWTAWFGVVGGTLELAVFLAKCHYLDPRNYNASRHFPWMYPAAGVLVLAGPGLVLAAAARVWPARVTPRLVLGVLGFVACLGLLFRCPIYTAVCLLLAFGLALRTSAWLAGRTAAFDRLVRRSVGIMVLLLAATAAACHGWQSGQWRRMPRPQPASGGPAPNVILIVLDTVRAESLSLYGYPRDTTPNLKRLAARGIRYDLAFATAPWTAPSHASMFTGRWRHELSVNWDRPLDRTTPTLAEFLAARGYATAGFVANTTYCSYETGLDRGFAHYEDYDVNVRAVLLCSALVQRTVAFLDRHPGPAEALGMGERAPAPSTGRKNATRINGDFLAWLDGHQTRARNLPFFAFLNYYDAHHPYLPGDASGEQPLGRPVSRAEVRLLKTWWDLDKRGLGPAHVTLARDAYDSCITALDRQLGRLFVALDQRGVLGNSLVIVTADHGEHFGEQRLFGHGCSLYRPEIHVPLLIFPPTAKTQTSAGRIVAAPVSLRNLAATVVAALGPAAAAESPFPGRSLLDGAWREPVLAELDAPPEADPNHGASPVCVGPLASVVHDGFHYIRRTDGREELYDLARDPAESSDLAASPQAAEMLRGMRRHLARCAPLRDGLDRTLR